MLLEQVWSQCVTRLSAPSPTKNLIQWVGNAMIGNNNADWYITLIHIRISSVAGIVSVSITALAF